MEASDFIFHRQYEALRSMWYVVFIMPVHQRNFQQPLYVKNKVVVLRDDASYYLLTLRYTIPREFLHCKSAQGLLAGQMVSLTRSLP